MKNTTDIVIKGENLSDIKNNIKTHMTHILGAGFALYDTAKIDWDVVAYRATKYNTSGIPRASDNLPQQIARNYQAHELTVGILSQLEEILDLYLIEEKINK